MLAIANLPREQIAAIAAPHGYHVAIATGEDSCIIGGLQVCASEAECALVQAGARVTRLPVEIASHTPYMADAAAPFARVLEDCNLDAPETPVLSGISAARLDSRAQAVEHLSRQLHETIVWDECMDACAEAGITVALELGPGAALSRMLQARHPGIACRSVADFRSLEGIRGWLRRQCE
jgi:[acyl-carrier-protein] S-malonyltransferase